MERRDFFLTVCAASVGVVASQIFTPAIADTAATGQSPTIPSITGDAVLKGVTGFFIHVLPVDAAAQNDGLIDSDIEDHVKTRLLAAPVPVSSKTDWMNSVTSLELSVVVDTVKNDAGVYGFHIDLNVREPVILERGKVVSTFASTWSTGVSGTCEAVSLPDQVRTAVGQGIDDLISAYQGQNT